MTTETMSVTLDSLLSKLMPPGERAYLRCAVGPARDEPVERRITDEETSTVTEGTRLTR